MSVAQNEKLTMKRAAFARHRGVSRKAVNAWEGKGYLALTDDDLVDVRASDERLDQRPEIYRGGVTSSPSAGNKRRVLPGHKVGGNKTTRGNNSLLDPAEALARSTMPLFPDPVHRGAYWMAGEMIKQIGALAAVAAIEYGARCQTAFAIERVLPIALMEAVTGLMIRNRIGPFVDGRDDHAVWPADMTTCSVDWKRAAAQAGEPHDEAAWRAFAEAIA